MFDQLRLFPEQAAEIAYRVDALLFFMLIVTGSVAISVFIVIIYFSIRYRRKSQRDRTPHGRDRRPSAPAVRRTTPKW